jgi:predicted dehydrogenase
MNIRRSAGDAYRVALVGHGFMGAVHSQAWRTAPSVFSTAPVVQSIVCGRDSVATREFAQRWGWRESATNWRAVLVRPDIDIVDICAPGDAHREIAIAALDAGKHVICEKPLANSLADARAMASAATRAHGAGARTLVGFNYRRTPALTLARQLVLDGRLGQLRHVRARYLQDWIADPEFPLVWRLQREHSGSGALGDLGAHIIDLAEHLSGQRVLSVSATLHTFVTERPLAASSSGPAAVGSADRGEVTVDDAALVTAWLGSGILATLEATRFATGRKNAMQIEVNGSSGSLYFDFEDMNQLWFYDTTEHAAERGFHRILTTEPEHPYSGVWWPPGHGLGYESTFVHEIADFLSGLQSGSEVRPTFADGLRNQMVLDAIERSALARSAWTDVAPSPKEVAND